MAIRVIYLVRHGQHDTNNPSGSELGGPLTPLGIKQATLTAKMLGQKPISSLHSSSLNRAEQTARIISKEFPAMNVQTTDLLWECIPTMTPKLQLEMPHYTEAMVAQDRKRAEIAFRRHFKVAKRNDRHDVIVCHGNLIRFFIAIMLKADPSSWVRMDLANCGVSQVLIQPDGDMALLCHNDWSHLPREMHTSTLRPATK
ncbi:MAG: hypothetical protein GX130_12885 [Candidatus Hydrogenedens sp.]|jgi:broad specificity phosphatase PhoE|nr:hypothetical protein [Candidatus Hydrogenedens sp.]